MRRKVTLQVRRLSDATWQDLIVRMRALGDVQRSWYKDRTIERYTVEVDEDSLPALQSAFGEQFWFLDAYPMAETWLNGRLLRYAVLLARLWPARFRRGLRLSVDASHFTDASPPRQPNS